MLPLLFLFGSGCAYTFGSGLTAGVLDEAQGKGRSTGLDGTIEGIVEKELIAQLGHQLGEGLRKGATDIDPEAQARLEKTIESLIAVATQRAGKGLRQEVSPELREMVQKDIVKALSEGIRGDLGASVEVTVDRVVHRALSSLRREIADEDTRIVITELLRDSVYYAMREDGATEAVGSTLETTLTENMLNPIQNSVGGMTELVARQLDESYKRTENTLKGVISALVLLSGVFGMMYFIRNRQVRRLEERNVQAERGLQNVDAALEQLDAGTRQAVLAKLAEYRHIEERKTSIDAAESRSDDYLRKRGGPGSGSPPGPKAPPKPPPSDDYGR